MEGGVNPTIVIQHLAWNPTRRLVGQKWKHIWDIFMIWTISHSPETNLNIDICPRNIGFTIWRNSFNFLEKYISNLEKYFCQISQILKQTQCVTPFPKKFFVLSSIWTDTLNGACLAVDGVSKILLGHPDQAGSKEKSYGHPIVKSEHLENVKCTKQMQ